MKPDTRLVDIAARRFRIAVILTAAIVFVYFGFILLVAFDKELLATIMVPGLSVGIALGAVVIFVAFFLTGIYVRWANNHYDAALNDIRGGKA